MTFHFTVRGKPQGKARARTFYNQKLGRMQSITPENTVSYEELIRWEYKAHGGRFLGDVPLCIHIEAYYPVPKSYSNKKREAALQGLIVPTVKPDCDNIIKVVLDALNGVAYHDDKQVVRVALEKKYADLGYLYITIEEL